MASSGPSAAVSNRQTQRIMEELRGFEANPPSFLRNLQPTKEKDLNVLTGTMIGSEGSDYATGHFDFSIEFLKEYPFKPPIFRFTTKICHPNVIIGGELDRQACHEQLLASWTPKTKLVDFLTEMHKLLNNPNYEIPVDNISVDGSPIADDYAPTDDGKPSDPNHAPAIKDRKTARQWTRWYAQQKS